MLRLMGIWDWFWLPLIVVCALGAFAESFWLPLRRPKRADLLPLFGMLILVTDVLGRDSQPLMERALKGCAVALFSAAALVLGVRWSRTGRALRQLRLLLRGGDQLSTVLMPRRHAWDAE